MSKSKGYTNKKLSIARRAVAVSASVTKEKNTIHSFTEIDITEPRRLFKQHFEKTGEKLSFTAYIINCLAQTVKENPQVNSFIKGRRQIFLDDINISVLVEMDSDGEKYPEPVVIKQAGLKTFRQINNEIREAKKTKGDKKGSLSGMTWIGFIPDMLLRTFVRIADRNITMAKRYGKIAVTAVGMFSKETVWFIPHGSGTVLLTIGSINNKVVEAGGSFETREHLCLTASFDHNIIDGAPAARFLSSLAEKIKNGEHLSIN